MILPSGKPYDAASAPSQAWMQGQTPVQIGYDNFFSRSAINPFALIPDFKNLSEVEHHFKLSWKELLTPDISPLWRYAHDIASSYLSALKTSGKCQFQQRQCPWMPPDPTRDGRIEGLSGSFNWSVAGNFAPASVDWFDPIQGLVPNCHFIATLQSLALTMPHLIVTRSRLSSASHRKFTLFDGVVWREFFVDETVPVFRPTSGSYALTVAASSSRSDENQLVGRVIGWPGVYEKAFAMAGLGVSHSQPNLLLPSYWVPNSFDADGLPSGTPASPLTALTGQQQLRADIRAGSISDLFAMVQSLCNADGYVVNPSHLGTLEANEADEWAAVKLVPSHAYSLCGWTSFGGRNYIILRNAWGKFQPDGDGTLSGSLHGRAFGNAGLFAMEVSRVFTWFSHIYWMS